jgi:MurNAc alpha-1-phosphate uridylyltransferase
MRAMILAAGRGERMRPLTDRTPKPLLQVGGETLIDRHLQALRAAGIRQVVINVSWLGEQIRERLGRGEGFGLDIVYSQEPPGALDTGGGIRHALGLLGDGPFLVVNGDTWTDVDLSSLCEAQALASEDLATLLLVPTPAYKAAHDFAFSEGRVVAGLRTHTFSGIGLYRPALFDAAPSTARFPLAPLLREAVEAGRVAGRVHHGEWYDVGTPERLRALDTRLLRLRG